MPTITLVACHDCAGEFAPEPAPLALGGEWPPGDMRVDYCPDCRPRHLAERDQFYARADEERRAKCAAEDHATVLNYWLSIGATPTDVDFQTPAYRFCQRCGETHEEMT